jgi:hypothetical protein
MTLGRGRMTFDEVEDFIVPAFTLYEKQQTISERF